MAELTTGKTTKIGQIKGKAVRGGGGRKEKTLIITS